MYTLEQLVRLSHSLSAQIQGQWVPARPLIGPLAWRIRDAWRVLRGTADAVEWPAGQ